MEDDTKLIAILKWTVNPRLPVPNIDSVDEEQIADMAVYHRIPQRLLARLQAERPRWSSPRLLTRLRIYHYQCKQLVNDKIQAAREIDQAMRNRGLHRPIWIKGFTTFALTGDDRNLHHSGDLDPFAEDLPAFWDVLQELRYYGKRKDTHEWAKLNRGEITLDVHQKYPMLAYPDSVHQASRASLVPEQNPEHWNLPQLGSDMAERGSIIWEHFVDEATPGKAAGTQYLLFPSPTWMCLIHCAHCFRSTVTRLHYMDARGGFRLYELINIYLLARHENFDTALFLKRVQEFGGDDALSLMNTFSHAFLGESILPALPSESTENNIYAEQLIFGGWIAPQQTDEWLTLRGIDQMVDQLQANIWKSGTRLQYRDIPRVISCGEPADVRELSIVWHQAEKWVQVEWDIRKDGGDYELLVHFGFGANVRAFVSDDAIKVQHKTESWQTTVEAAATLEDDDAGNHRIKMVCPLPEIPARFTIHRTMLPLFLAAKQSGKVSYIPVMMPPN